MLTYTNMNIIIIIFYKFSFLSIQAYTLSRHKKCRLLPIISFYLIQTYTLTQTHTWTHWTNHVIEPQSGKTQHTRSRIETKLTRKRANKGMTCARTATGDRHHTLIWKSMPLSHANDVQTRVYSSAFAPVTIRNKNKSLKAVSFL
jgi:hypothetical protein